MAKRGNEIQKAYAERLREERSHHKFLQRCLWCPDTFEVTVGEGVARYLEHLEEKHPDRPAVPVKRKHSARSNTPRIAGSKSLDENIAGAREAGAAGWATSADDA